jgi:hypothetical protein
MIPLEGHALVENEHQYFVILVSAAAVLVCLYNMYIPVYVHT